MSTQLLTDLKWTTSQKMKTIWDLISDALLTAPRSVHSSMHQLNIYKTLNYIERCSSISTY